MGSDIVYVPQDNVTLAILKEAKEIEHHLHNEEIWIGNGVSEDSLTGYQLTSGNNDFGSEVLLLDTVNTPIRTGKLFFDLHRLFVTAISSATPYLIRLIYGTGTVGDAETAKQYTTVPVTSAGVGSNLKGAPSDVLFDRVAAGTKVWAKCKNVTNLSTISVLIGLHEYAE